MRIRRTIILLISLAIQIASADDKTFSPDFSIYPKTYALWDFISVQTNVSANLGRTNLLRIVSFLGSDRIGLQYLVKENGQSSNVRNVWNWARQGEHFSQLSGEQLERLRSVIKELPAKNVTPPVDQLVIVSFRDGTNWLTRSYSQTDLPPAMRKIYDIIGKRSETPNMVK